MLMSVRVSKRAIRDVGKGVTQELSKLSSHHMRVLENQVKFNVLKSRQEVMIMIKKESMKMEKFC